VFAGDPDAMKNNPAVNMLQGIGAWPTGMFNGNGDAPSSSGKQQQAAASKPSSPSPSSSDGARPASGASPSNPAYLSGSTPASSTDVGKAVGIAVGVTAAVCAAVAAGVVAIRRKRAGAGTAALPVAMPPPSDYPPVKTVD
jgi:hypothetical protein